MSMKKKLRKQIFKALKKHNETLTLLNTLLTILSLILAIVMPIVAERVVYFQSVREVWLPTVYDYHTNVGTQITISISVTLVIERTDGTVEYLKGK